MKSGLYCVKHEDWFISEHIVHRDLYRENKKDKNSSHTKLEGFI